MLYYGRFQQSIDSFRFPLIRVGKNKLGVFYWIRTNSPPRRGCITLCYQRQNLVFPCWTRTNHHPQIYRPQYPLCVMKTKTWCAIPDSNREPADLESAALTIGANNAYRRTLAPFFRPLEFSNHHTSRNTVLLYKLSIIQ